MSTIEELAKNYKYDDDLTFHILSWYDEKRIEKRNRKQQDDYYQEHILDTVVAKFDKKPGENFDNVIGKTDLMILSVGTSFAPIVLSILYVKPKKILLLHSTDPNKGKEDRVTDPDDYPKGTEGHAERIIKYIAKIDIDLAANCRKQPIEETNAVNIYQAIYNYYLETGKPKNIVIDPTGGTKVMAAAVAMTRTALNAVMVYVGHKDSINDGGIPFPGSEYLERIMDPLELLGVAKYDKAMQLMNEYDYNGACKLLEELKNNTVSLTDKEKYELVHKLLCVYSSWDDLKFCEAKKSMDELLDEISKRKIYNSKMILAKNVEFLEKQKVILDVLAGTYGEMENAVLNTVDKKNINGNIANVIYSHIKNCEDKFSENFIFMIHAQASRKSGQGKYDMAALLAYRLLEFISQRRLAEQGINTEKPSFAHIYGNAGDKFIDERAFINALIAVARSAQVKEVPNLSNNDGVTELNDEKISLLNGYIILKTLKDKIFPEPQSNQSVNLSDLITLKKKTGIRNSGYLSHGYMVINQSDYDDFNAYTTAWLKRFCKVESINFSKTQKEHTFITPEEFN